SLVALMACALLQLTACSTTQTPRAGDAIATLTSALADHTLDGVPLAEGDAASSFAEQIEPLAHFDVDVEDGKARYDGDEASVPLTWSWSVEGRAWEYETQAHLVREGDEWQVKWTPQALFPD